MSFEVNRDATKFWVAVGVQNSGDNNGAYMK